MVVSPSRLLLISRRSRTTLSRTEARLGELIGAEGTGVARSPLPTVPRGRLEMIRQDVVVCVIGTIQENPTLSSRHLICWGLSNPPSPPANLVVVAFLGTQSSLDNDAGPSRRARRIRQALNFKAGTGVTWRRMERSRATRYYCGRAKFSRGAQCDGDGRNHVWAANRVRERTDAG
jgi:hypothetical protein